jgi:hypothetical protein
MKQISGFRGAASARRVALAAGVGVLAASSGLLLPSLAHAIAGIEGTFEYAIDAPWRIEPRVLPSGALAYGAIPIQISIHDANNVGHDREGVSDPHTLALGRVCKVVVRERGSADAPGEPPRGKATSLLFSRLEEVEYTRGRWPAPGEPYPAVPEHALCRAWKGEDCTGFDRVGGSSEWHASFGYQPASVKPATAVSLQVEVHLTKDPLSSCEIVPDYNHIRLVNELRVYFAPAPLPRFGGGWLYGDLHYHSQGTDNEGESAYNYRGVIRAMGAMGMDFAFATEHASNSQQVIDVDAKLGDIFHLEFPPSETRAGLRDMSRGRFRFLQGVLHGPGGANVEAPLLTGLAGRRRAAPQVFLGGEVDLIPELAPGTAYGDLIPWGNGQEWSTENLCFGNLLDLGGPLTIGCEDFGVHLLEKTATNPDAVLVDDIQGFSVDFGRHHIVYLPRRAGDTQAFVRSDTGPYGGASRRFTDLKPELERHGYFFAAHPLSHFERGDDFLTDPGPTDIPWTDHLYDQVWRSPAWLGLQFWNEDARLREEVPPWSAFTTRDPVPSPDFCTLVSADPSNPSYVCPEPGGDVGYERYDSPALGVPYAYLPVDRAQAGFGSGLFHLDVAAPVSGRWSEHVDTVEEKLHHGAFTWDRLNHWGLDVRKTKALDWLPSFLAPRRLFMAGGSDAHGDLGYRRTGYLIRTEKINDAALGKPRNLVEVGAPRGRRLPRGANGAGITVHSQVQVADAIADGRFSVTDGPALRIAVDRNANGVIDEGDATMGDVVRLRVRDEHALPVLVEWRSTPEFGPVARVDLYVGARQSRDDLATPPLVEKGGRTYAPPGAGVFHSSIPGTGLPDPIVDDPPYDRMNDNYWRDPTGLLRFQPTDGFQGTRRILLDLGQFPATQNLPADRFFVRAFAVTDHPDPEEICVTDHEGCLRRYAFTNPIWAIETTYVCSGDAALDDVAPRVSCNTPPTTTRRSLPASFAAAASDVCPVRVEVGEVGCEPPGGPGRPGSARCRVTAEGDTVTIARGTPAGTVVRWTATATDSAGNTAAAACRTEIVGPGQP